ncbi:DNA-directed RNA polymerases I, II, and III subunit RPABC4-like [Hibiscus syriacus]|uniref:DNA-directed RNA polymerases I, II, and III subunit RPABC4-like n=1 Tax=Hibiscus syriacus TaxID=106335 RepID=A0A6A3B745_HIBSY|nr:DNA-directed RNA polymerases I, II, and III subunit RPABC4-like [Hibiscus syriacus]
MVRASSSSKKQLVAETPEATERRRLKKLALKNHLLSETQAAPKSYVPLSPSKQVIKHHGKDILRKSQRKNRFLFSFPGLLAPISGGKIGELKNLGSKNPILYLDFPQGQMKLFGTIVYPKNRYLSLLFSRGGKNVMCEDYFDNMIVFSDAWWIGKKDENPEEAQLDFPKELTEIKEVDMESLDTESGDALSDDESNLKTKIEVTPTRHSARNAGKRFKFAEASSGDDSVGSDVGPLNREEKKVRLKLDLTDDDTTISSVPVDLGSHDTEDSQVSKQIQTNLTSVTKSRKTSQSTATVTKSKENSNTDHGSLVQATISTLFKKVEEKGPRGSEKSLSPKVSGKKLQCKNSKRKTDQDESSKKGKVTEGRTTGIKRRKKESEVEDDIEEISSTSEDTNGSDEDWST